MHKHTHTHTHKLAILVEINMLLHLELTQQVKMTICKNKQSYKCLQELRGLTL